MEYYSVTKINLTRVKSMHHIKDVKKYYGSWGSWIKTCQEWNKTERMVLTNGVKKQSVVEEYW